MFLLFINRYIIVKKYAKERRIPKMAYLKKLYGKAIIDSSDSEELQDDYKMELEYYQVENEASSKPYGVEIVKKIMENDRMNIEDKKLESICDKEQDTNNLLEILITNKVTPISVDDVIEDLTKIKVI